MGRGGGRPARGSDGVSGVATPDLELHAGGVLSESPEWLEPVRRAAAERFGRTGFPASRDEEWRFTPIGPVAQTAWRPAPTRPDDLDAASLAPFVFGHPEWSTLVFVNGIYHPALGSIASLPSGVTITSLADAVRADLPLLRQHLSRHAPIEGSPFTAFNAAAFRDGGLVHVPAGHDLASPVHLVFVTTDEAAGAAIHPRNLIVVERGARASVIESYVTLADLFRAGGLDEELATEWADIELKYGGYLSRERRSAQRMAEMDGLRIPENMRYDGLHALSFEARQKLSAARPETLGQAGRIPGVSPSDLQNLVLAVVKSRK